MKKFRIIFILVMVKGLASSTYADFAHDKFTDAAWAKMTEDNRFAIKIDDLAWFLSVEIDKACDQKYIKKQDPSSGTTLLKQYFMDVRERVDELQAVLRDAPVKTADYNEMIEVLEDAIKADTDFVENQSGDGSSKNLAFWKHRVGIVTGILLRYQKFDKAYYDSLTPPAGFLEKLEKQRREIWGSETEAAQCADTTNAEPRQTATSGSNASKQSEIDSTTDDSTGSFNSDSASIEENRPLANKNKSFLLPLLVFSSVGCLILVVWRNVRKR